ncbi:hypothetical protein JB92DRAFT_2979474 [Gautieria morchelliformis]|nr:hypothetical protein JB92DRAFT_2979474 [Gautieria morchelliformis]
MRSFRAELKLGLQSRRLRDAQHELQKRQAQVDRLTAQLREQELDPALVRAKIGDGGEVPARHNEVHEQVDLEESSIGDKDIARVDTSEPSSCIRCEIRSQSAKLSLLHLRTMEFRVRMSERRQIETESHAVRLLDALQSERRVRLQLEAELVAERQKRRGAETVGEAIANEAKWPFVMPDMLDVFLKLEGMVEEVGREGKEG